MDAVTAVMDTFSVTRCVADLLVEKVGAAQVTTMMENGEYSRLSRELIRFGALNNQMKKIGLSASPEDIRRFDSLEATAGFFLGSL